jgi:hypothetical protein
VGGTAILLQLESDEVPDNLLHPKQFAQLEVIYVLIGQAVRKLPRAISNEVIVNHRGQQGLALKWV